MAQQSPRQLVVSCLHWNGEYYSKLSPGIHIRARSLCDGFGKLDRDMPNYQDMLWDWSHVRDSSDEALERCALFLEGVLSA